MITFYGYAVKKDGKYLGYNPKRNEFDRLYKKQFYIRPEFPVVGARRWASEEANGQEVVKVKLTKEEVGDGK